MSARFGAYRLFRRCALVGATAASLLFAGCSPAFADPVVSGTVGDYTAVTCGWYPQEESLFDLAPHKRVRINLPSVSGVTADQLVWARVRFMQSDTDGGFTEYRSGWFYTYASPGQMSTSWTSYNTGSSGYTYAEDEGTESGFSSGDSQNPVTIGFVQLYWMTDGTTTGEVGQVAENAADVDYPNMCNGGGTMF